MTSTVNDITAFEPDDEADALPELRYADSGTYMIFDGDEVRPLRELMSNPDIPDYATDLADLGLVFAGLKTKVVFTTSEPDGMSIAHVTVGPDFILLPHSHSANCAYYVTAGEILLGRRRLGPGAGFYVPADRRYSYVAGPEGAELIEIRDRTTFDMKMGALSPTRYAAIVENAKAHGGWPDL